MLNVLGCGATKAAITVMVTMTTTTIAMTVPTMIAVTEPVSGDSKFYA